MAVTFNPAGGARSAPAGNTGAQEASPATTERLDWNGFSLGKIPTDSYAIRTELRRSYAGVDQEMLRQMAEKDQKQRDLKKQEDANKPKAREDGSSGRREFALVETPLVPPVEESSRSHGGAAPGPAKGAKGDPEDLFEQALDLSSSFNESGATFKV